MIKSIPNGVYPTMITPYTDDNKVDLNAVEQILNWYWDRGVDGIFAICQSSEIFFLSFEERLELLRFIMKHAPKGMAIVASGHTANVLDRQIYEANAFINEGIDAYVLISNRLATQDESDDVFVSNFEKFQKGVPEIDFGVYECPYPYKRLLTPETLRKLCTVGNMSFVKDTCCSVEMIKEKIDASKEFGLKLFNANAATLLDTLKLGAAGYSGVMANFHPELYSYLCKNWDKDPEKAKIISDFVGCASMSEAQVYPICAKYYMTLTGVKMGITSRARSINEFTPNRVAEIDQFYGHTEFFKKQIGIK